MRPNNTDEATVRRIGFCWCKVLLPHDLADGNQRIRISEKTLEFSSTVLTTLTPYLVRRNKDNEKAHLLCSRADALSSVTLCVLWLTVKKIVYS